VEKFRPYVVDLVTKFKDDRRVIFWETFNEPSNNNFSRPLPQGPFSWTLRRSAFQWAKDVQPRQPVIACWGENEATELNNHHQYALPWGAVENAIFRNDTGFMRGGVLTEAGARWFETLPSDVGSPLTVVDWLQRLRKNPHAPFVPGVFINFECMVGNDNTRWHWLSKPGSNEPAIPWHEHVFPDGTPVSYTEAGAIRRYVSGNDDFLFFEDFLGGKDNADSAEVFASLHPGDTFSTTPLHTGDVLVEASIMPSNTTVVSVGLCDSLNTSCWFTRIDVANSSLSLLRSGTHEGEQVLSTFNISTLDNGIVIGAWNMVRMRFLDNRAEVWFNPMYPEVFPEGVPMPGEPPKPIRPMPPRIQLDLGNASSALSSDNERFSYRVDVVAERGDANLDYMSVLPPVVYGQHFEPPAQ